MGFTTLLTRLVAAFRGSGHLVTLNLPPPPAESDIPSRPVAAEQAAQDRNTPGDFWVEPDCCLLCGIPWHYAPDLFGYDDSRCWVKRQPATADEQDRMLTVMQTQDLGCVRYRGGDPRFLPDRF